MKLPEKDVGLMTGNPILNAHLGTHFAPIIYLKSIFQLELKIEFNIN